MTDNQTPSDRTRSAILSYLSQAEFRRAHNFATATRSIEKLDLATTPTPWSLGQQSETVFLTPASSKLLLPQATDREPGDSNVLPPPIQRRSSASASATVIETDFDIETRVDEDDLPFYAPESWLKPRQAEGGQSVLSHGKNWNWNWNWNWSERSTAGFLGFAAGMLIVVPIVLLLSLTTDQKPVPSPPPEATIASVSRPDVKQVAMAKASISSGTWFNTQAAPAPEADNRSTLAIEVISQAQKALTEGRIDHARIVLRAAASPDAPRLWFMLAETYDPVVARQWANDGATNSRLQVADLNFALFYYQQALTHGIQEAQARLDNLMKR